MFGRQILIINIFFSYSAKLGRLRSNYLSLWSFFFKTFYVVFAINIPNSYYGVIVLFGVPLPFIVPFMDTYFDRDMRSVNVVQCSIILNIFAIADSLSEVCYLALTELIIIVIAKNYKKLHLGGRVTRLLFAYITLSSHRMTIFNAGRI